MLIIAHQWVSLARIRVGTIRMNLGHFKSAEDAHKAYIEAAKIHHGEFANYES